MRPWETMRSYVKHKFRVAMQRNNKKGTHRAMAVAVLLLMAVTAMAQQPLIPRLRTDSLRAHALPDSLSSYLLTDTLDADGLDATLRAIDVQTDSLVAQADSLLALGADSLLADTVQTEVWMPDPSRSTWMALAFPGAGQIYNRKYWKLPIVYGGFLGCAYALTWNNQMYSDYSQAYLDIMDDDPATASFVDFLPPNYNYTANAEYLKKVFKSRKDRYRRYRDLSIFSFIGVYLISVVDAYVDAELSHFDISEDLGMHVTPSVIDNSNYFTMHSQSVGLKCNITF